MENKAPLQLRMLTCRPSPAPPPALESDVDGAAVPKRAKSSRPPGIVCSSAGAGCASSAFSAAAGCAPSAFSAAAAPSPLAVAAVAVCALAF